MTFLLIPIGDDNDGGEGLATVLGAIAIGGSILLATLLYWLTPGFFPFLKFLYTFEWWASESVLGTIFWGYVTLTFPLFALVLLRDAFFCISLQISCVYPVVKFCYLWLDNAWGTFAAIVVTGILAIIVLFIIGLLRELLYHLADGILSATLWKLPGAEDSGVMKFLWVFLFFILIPGVLIFAILKF